MESIGVLQAVPLNPYLDAELSKRFNLFKLWTIPEKSQPDFLASNAKSIRAVAGNATKAADGRLIDALPRLEIVACYSAGVDKVDLVKCRQRGVRVTNAGNLVTADAADVALALMLAVLRKLPQCDRYLWSRRWSTDGEFQLTSKLKMPTVESIGVLMACPMNLYLEDELSRRYNLFRFWNFPDRKQFLSQNAHSIRAVVGNASAGANPDLIDALPKLEIVSSFSVGLDKIDLLKCKERGISVTNTPDVLTDDVADLAIALMMAVLRRIPQCDRYVRSGNWKMGAFNLTTKFSGKRVGIIGLGRIGCAIAQRAEAFDCPISYHSRTKKSDSNYTYYQTVIELASNCDILVVACALTEETRHIVNRQVMDALGPKGVLINIGRGPHVDERELVSALIEGRLGGAGLDVFEHEPDVPEELFGLENVVLLPHVGSATIETRTAMADLVLANLEAHFLGQPLLTPVV